MNSSQYKNIQDPIARAEAMRAEAMANAIFDGAVALSNLVKAAAAKVSGYVQYRRTVDVLTGMTDRELDDIGITRGDIPAVARGVDPRPAQRHPGDALARRLALAEAFEQEKAPAEVAGLRSNDNRPAAAA